MRSENEARQDFYKKLDENRKMEFINGKIVFHGPVMKRHNTATGKLYKLLDSFADWYDLDFRGCSLLRASKKTLVSLTRNDYEPDICFWSKKRAAGFTEEQTQFPAPDFVAEVLSHQREHRPQNQVPGLRTARRA